MSSPDPLARTATRQRLLALHRAGLLDTSALDRALALAGYRPGAHAWRVFLEWLLGLGGVALVLSGVIFFFAYNWAALSQTLKFAGLEAALLLCVVGAWWWSGSRGGRLWLMGACILPGVLLAVYGQVYQTGADPYGLFLGWALLMAGFVVAGRSPWPWLVLLVLLDLALVLYWEEMIRPGGPLPGTVLRLDTLLFDRQLGLLMTTGNVLALVAWELAARRLDWLGGEWPLRLVALLALTLPGGTAFAAILMLEQGWGLSLLVYLTVLGGVLGYYRLGRRDLAIQAAALLGGIVVLTTLVGRWLVEAGTEGEAFWLLALLVVGQSVAAVQWLRRQLTQGEA